MIKQAVAAGDLPPGTANADELAHILNFPIVPETECSPEDQSFSIVGVPMPAMDVISTIAPRLQLDRVTV